MGTLETLSIRVRTTGAKRGATKIKTIGTEARVAGKGVASLQRELIALGGALAIGGLVKLADTFTVLQNRIRTVTNSMRQLTFVTNELFDIANKTRSSVEATVEIYARLQRGTRGLGISQSRLLKVTETLNKATILSGATSKEAENAIIQLSQGLASGALRGDELRSVLEQLPFVADLVAERMGVARGALRDLGKEGKITTKVVIDALEASEKEVADLFEKTIPTIGQAFAVLRNSAIKAFGELGTESGALAGAAKAILFVAKNMDVLANAVVVVAKVITGLLVRKALVLLIAKMKVFGALLLANPLGILITALATAVVFLDQFKEKLGLTVEVTATFESLWASVKSTVIDAWTAIKEAFGAAFEFMRKTLKDFFSIDIPTALRFFEDFADNIIKLFKIVAQTVFNIFTKLIPALVNLIVVGKDTIIGFAKGEKIQDSNLEFLKDDIANRQRQIKLLNEQIKTQERLGNTEGANALRRERDAARELNRERRRVLETVARRRLISGKAGEETRAVNELNDALKQTFDEAARLAEEDAPFAKARFAREKARKVAAESAFGFGVLPEDLDDPIAGGIAPTTKGKGKKDRFFKDFLRLESRLDPITGNLRELFAAQDLLTEAFNRGVISLDRYEQLLGKVNELYKDSILPFDAMLQKYQEESELLGMARREREITIEARKIENDLIKKGVDLTAQQAVQIRILATGMKELREALPARDALANLQGAGFTAEDIGPFQQSLRDLRSEVENVGHAVENIMIRAFKGMEDAIVDLVATGKLNFRSMVQSMLADLTRLLIRMLVVKALSDTIGGVSGTALASDTNVLQSLAGSGGAPKVNAVGSQFMVGGPAGVDNTLVAFRASRGERVTVETANQQATGERFAGDRVEPEVNLTVVNAMSQQSMLEALQTAEGSRVVMNIVHENADAMKDLV